MMMIEMKGTRKMFELNAKQLIRECTKIRNFGLTEGGWNGLVMLYAIDK
jgi:hypothetical protein